MRVRKNGKVVLDRGEVRVGNFFARDEGNGRVSLTDVNGCFKVRVWKGMPLGSWLGGIIGMGDAGLVTIKTYVAAMWSLLSVVPDDEFIGDVVRCADDALHRHPDWYGVGAEVSGEVGHDDEISGDEGE